MDPKPHTTTQGLAWRRVTRDEWLAFIHQFPGRQSYKTGICEPPVEIAEWPIGRAIASVTFGDWPEGAKAPDWNVKVYRITDAMPEIA